MGENAMRKRKKKKENIRRDALLTTIGLIYVPG